MNFELNKEQKQIKKAVNDFVKGEFKKEIVHELINNKEYPEKILKKSQQVGVLKYPFSRSIWWRGIGTF